MAKKKNLQPTAPVMTRGQLSRAERERRQIRNLYTSVIGIVGLALAILIIAAASTFIIKPNEAVASVNGVNITRATYQKLRRWNLYQSLMQQQLSGGQSSVTTVDATALSAVNNEPTLDSTTVNQLIDSEVLRQSAKSDPKVQITASDNDLRADAKKRNLPSPTPPTTPAPNVTSTAVVTGTTHITPTATLTFTPGPPTHTATVTATLPPVPGAEKTAEAIYSREIQSYSKGTSPDASDSACQVGCPNLSESDFLHIVIEPGYLQTSVTDKLAGQVITEPEQIHAQHILTDTEAGAKKIIQMLDQHGPDPDSKYFTELANTQSSEQINNQKHGQPLTGGDLGWFPKANSSFVDEFVNGAWPVKAGEYTKTAVKSSFGYHVIKVLARDPKRPLPQDKIDSAKSKVYTDWFDAKKKAAKTTNKAPAAVVPTTQPAVTEPTQAPIELTPASGTVPAGAAPPGNTPASAAPPSGITPAATPPTK